MGKCSSDETVRVVLAASGTKVVTVAMPRRTWVVSTTNIPDLIDPKKDVLLPNTSGNLAAGEAARLAPSAVPKIKAMAKECDCWPGTGLADRLESAPHIGLYDKPMMSVPRRKADEPLKQVLS
jgi:Thiazole biosynthesis protein ThiG